MQPDSTQNAGSSDSGKETDVPAFSLQGLTAEEVLPLSERAYRRLRDAITQGALPPRTAVSERALAQQLGISAQPVREAMHRLESEGMIVTAPRKGSFIADFTAQRLEEMGLICISLECAAAAMLARRGCDDQQIAQLREQLRVMEYCTRNADLLRLAEENRRFHAILHQITGNVLLIRTIEATRAYAQFNRDRNLRSWPGEPQRALREHAAILWAIRARQPELAEERMRDHVERGMVQGGLIPLTPAAARRLRHVPDPVRRAMTWTPARTDRAPEGRG